jgi:hypothetical protein
MVAPLLHDAKTMLATALKEAMSAKIWIKRNLMESDQILRDVTIL